MNRTLLALLTSLSVASSVDAAAPEESLYTLEAVSLEGKPVKLKKFKGKVVLVVNTASKCGYTPQYEGLQSLYDKYKGRGLVVLGFPSNDFRGQEPGSSVEIKKFCQANYGVSFPLFEKGPVTGERTQPVFRFLKASPVGSKDGEIGWNFTKFLVDRDGRVAARWDSKTKPESQKVVTKIEELLSPKKG